MTSLAAAGDAQALLPRGVGDAGTSPGDGERRCAWCRGELRATRGRFCFCAWLFALLGMSPGDELVDMFPGTGVVGAAWRELSSGAGVALEQGATAP